MPTILRSITTTAGFLQDAPIHFAPGLTCIIGSRGTCKSTVVETLRFAFNCDPTRVKELIASQKKETADTHPCAGIVYATLADGRACCAVEEHGAAGSHSLTIERDIYSEPRLYREGVKELSDASVLDRIEIYSQGDLQRIAEDDGLRLELIDRPHKAMITRLKAQRDDAAKQLRELGPAIRERRAEIESRRTEIRGLEALRAQLNELQASRPSLSTELDREREAFLGPKHFSMRSRG